MSNRINKSVATPKYKVEDYRYEVGWSEEDQAFIAGVLEFPSVTAYGESLDEALQEIRTAVELVLEDLEESGEPMPEPIGKKSFSGNFVTRAPKSLHRRLAIEAAREGVSLNQLVIAKLSA